MKSIKNKLIASVAMLVVATVMMTSASFAWFTVSTAPEVTQIDVEISTTKNLEIAQDGGENKVPTEVDVGQDGDQYWGNNVTSFGNATLEVPAELDETGSTDVLKSIIFGADGRPDWAASLTLGEYNSTLKGYYYTTEAGEGVTNTTEGKKAAVAFPIWLRTNTALSDVTVTVTDGSGTDAAKIDAVVYGPVKSGITAGAVGDNATAKYVKTGEKIDAMTAGTSYLYYIIAYGNGDDILAADIADGVKATGIKVQFNSSTLVS